MVCRLRYLSSAPRLLPVVDTVPRSRFLSSASYVFVSREWRRGKSVWATCPRHVARHVTGFLPLSTWTGWGRTVRERKGRRGERRLAEEIFSSFRIYARISPATVPQGPRDRWLPLKSQTRSTLQEACPPFSPTLRTRGTTSLGNMWLS